MIAVFVSNVTKSVFIEMTTSLSTMDEARLLSVTLPRAVSTTSSANQGSHMILETSFQHLKSQNCTGVPFANSVLVSTHCNVIYPWTY